MTGGFLVLLLFGLFCAFVVYAPGEVTKLLLAAAWVLMALAAIGLPVLSFFRLI